MRISARTQYALRAMVALAASDGPLPAGRIATEQDIPRRFCDNILLHPRRAGLIQSARPREGYWLARAPELISVADVIYVTEGVEPPAHFPGVSGPLTGDLGKGARPRASPAPGDHPGRRRAVLPAGDDLAAARPPARRVTVSTDRGPPPAAGTPRPTPSSPRVAAKRGEPAPGDVGAVRARSAIAGTPRGGEPVAERRRQVGQGPGGPPRRGGTRLGQGRGQRPRGETSPSGGEVPDPGGLKVRHDHPVTGHQADQFDDDGARRAAASAAAGRTALHVKHRRQAVEAAEGGAGVGGADVVGGARRVGDHRVEALVVAGGVGDAAHPGDGDPGPKLPAPRPGGSGAAAVQRRFLARAARSVTSRGRRSSHPPVEGDGGLGDGRWPGVPSG